MKDVAFGERGLDFDEFVSGFDVPTSSVCKPVVDCVCSDGKRDVAMETLHAKPTLKKLEYRHFTDQKGIRYQNGRLSL